jgi:DNA-directed RNA polymerase specialized sigma24 family protein
MEGEDELWEMMARAREARDKIVTGYLPWAESLVARLCRRRRIPDLEVEGAAGDGLLRAVARYNPAHKVAFASFAALHVRGAVLDMARKNDPRQWRHGSKPNYTVASVESPAEMPGVRDGDALSPDMSDMIDGMLRAVKTAPGRELLVRCAMCGESVQEVADRLGIALGQADVELDTARRQAADFLVDEGAIPFHKAKRMLNCVQVSNANRRALSRTSFNKLAEMAKRSLVARAKSGGSGGDHVLSGMCSCGALVRGPRAPHGPIPVKCGDCGATVNTM